MSVILNKSNNVYNEELDKFYRSFSNLSGLYSPPFDPDGKIVEAMSKKMGITIQALKDIWEQKRIKGVKLHDYFFGLIKEKGYFKRDGVKYLLCLDSPFNTYTLNENRCYIERVIYSDEYNVCWISDLILVNTKGEVIIIDYKFIDKDLRMNGFDNETMFEPLTLPNSDYYKYFLELNLGSFMLKNLNLKIKELVLFIYKPEQEVEEVQLPVNFDIIEKWLKDYETRYKKEYRPKYAAKIPRFANSSENLQSTPVPF